MGRAAKRLSFLWVPFTYLLFVWLTRYEMQRFHYSWFDPAYAYLFNGLTFATGSCDIGHIDHPGTPMQLFCALIIKITTLLNGAENLTTDVLSNPEYYLGICSVCASLLVVASVYALGVAANKVTRSTPLSLLVQVSPLLSLKAVYFSPVIATEPLVTATSIGLVALLLIQRQRDSSLPTKMILLIALLSGLLVSTKISALPLLALPFFFLENWKRRSIYAFATVAFAIAFVSPVLPKMNHFLLFVERMFTHQGSYGTGEAKVMDWKIYTQSLWKIFTGETPFTLHLLLLIAAWYFLFQTKTTSLVLKRLLTGITVATLLSVFVVARQYSFHYLIPVYVAAMPIQVYFWLTLFKDKITLKPIHFQWLAITSILLVFLRLYVQFHFFPGYKNPVDETKHQIEHHYKGKYIVLNNGNPGAFPHPALYFGLAYTGNSKKGDYSKILSNTHPGILWSPQNGFTNWDSTLPGSDVFSVSDSIYLYCRAATTEQAMNEINSLFVQNNLQQFCTLKSVYQNQKTGEVVAISLNDTASIKKKMIPTETVLVTMEERTTDGKEFVSVCGRYHLSGGSNQTSTHAFEGTYSAVMTGADAYALNLTLPVTKGESFRLNAWQLTQNGNLAHWVASAPKSSHFYTSTAQTKAQAGIWHKTELVFKVPSEYNDTLINLYFWLPVNDTLYVDQLKIERFDP